MKKLLFTIPLLTIGCTSPDTYRVNHVYLEYQNKKLLNVVKYQLEMLQELATLDNPVEVSSVEQVISDSKELLEELDDSPI